MENEELKENSPKRLSTNVGIPLLYTNGVLVNLTIGDISLGITVNGDTTHFLNMSLSTAKELADSLARAISDYETRTDSKVLKLSEVASKMRNTRK